MTDFTANLDHSLELLFQYSKNFNLSIELVQKLSQQLKLDTFVDTDAFSHTIDQPLKDEAGNIIKFQRLSIAGSLILIEFDFVDSTIYRVSFSSASQLEDKKFDHQSKKPTILQQDSVHTIKLNFEADLNDSIISKSSDSNIEHILLGSLKGNKLDTFPTNLEYLTNLDRLSTTDIDLFNYLDNLGLVLYTINQIEFEDSTNWLLVEGYSSLIGKLSVNKRKTNQVGFFLDFWKDFRYLNHEYNTNYDSDKLILGKEYNLVLKIDHDNFIGSFDYLAEVRDHSWEINGETYQFQFPDDSHLSPTRGASNNDKGTKFTSNWNLSWTLNHGIFVPINVLEFIGIDHFTEIGADSFFNTLNDDKEVLLTVKDQDYNISIKNEIHSKFVFIDSVMMKKINDLPLFIKVFRNHIVLSNILSQLINEHCNEMEQGQEIKVDSKIKDKLKDSLQLVDDKILSLRALNKTDIEDEFIDLDEFMKDSSPPLQKQPENLTITISNISFDSANFDVSLSIKGEYNEKKVDENLEISNGIVISKSDSRFVNAIKVSEDILLSLSHCF